MKPADLARIEIAKRAYLAAQPRATEIQIGVRRTRLALQAGKRRRNWLSKGLVLVTLAVGSMAYAKPHALGELVEQVLRQGTSVPSQQHAHSGAASAPAPVSPTQLVDPAARAVATKAGPQTDQPSNASAITLGAAAPTTAAATTTAATTPTAATAPVGAATPAAAATPGAATTTTAAATPAGATTPTAAAATLASPEPRWAKHAVAEPGASGPALSDWGRVGQALAAGDEARALSALHELSESGDASTRDKADLGLAQLLMARGHSDQACTLARSLTHRRASGNIERQARALLERCAR